MERVASSRRLSQEKYIDLFSAKPLIIHGRYTKSGGATIKLKGKFAGQEIVREIPVNFPNNAPNHDVLATLWARTQIDDLSTKGKYDEDEEAVIINQQTKRLITQIGIEYRLLTDFTSFVAVEEKIVNRKGKSVKVNVPVELPDGVSELAVQSDNEPPPSVKLPIKMSTKGSQRIVMNGGVSVVGYGSGSGSGSGAGSGPMPRIVSGGVVNGKAINLPTPAYPPAAKAAKASGSVQVQVTIDESGDVISATPVGGHALLRANAEVAARQAKFAPTMMSGQPVKTTGIIVYNFTDGNNSATVSVGNQTVVSETTPPPVKDEKQVKLKEKLHFWLYQMVERLQKGETNPTANEANFVKDGKANISITLTVKTSEVIEKLKQLGFEFVSENETNLVGRIAVDKLAQIVEIEEVQLVLPIIE